MSYFKFSSWSGRIKPSTATAAYVPQGLKPTVMEAPAPVFDSSRTKPAQVPAFMSVAASETRNGGVMPKAAAYVKIQNLQSSMTETINKAFVWQVKGVADRFPYLLTMTLAAAATGVCLYYGATLTFPKKKE